jgi:polar amino acid transport system substrate-binding protein
MSLYGFPTNRKFILTVFLSVIFSMLIQISAHAQESTITIIGEDEWYPYAAFKDGKLQGLAVDIIEASFAAMKVKVNFKSAPYARCLMLAETGQELACFDSLKDSSLTSKFLFHEVPIFDAEIGIYALENSTEKNIQVDKLSGKKVGVTHGYTYTDKVDNDNWIIREVAPTDLSNLRKLILKRSDYSLVYTRVVDYLLVRYSNELKGKFKKVGCLKENSLFVSFSKKRPESIMLANLLDEGLRKIKKTGEYAKIEMKWLKPLP